jgi:uncharacterized protein (TIGR02246 family)
MRYYALLLACLGLFIFTMGCKQEAPPPPNTREADVKAVQDLEAAWVKDMSTKDVDKVASYFADDGAELFPNMPTATGRDNIKALWKPFLADPNFSLTFQSTRTEASKGGDLVYSIGTYSLTMSAPHGKKTVTDKGKYLTVWAKQADGTWKAAADMSSSDLPAPGGKK